VILHSIGDGLVTCDPAGRVTLMNPAAARMAARDPEQSIGQPLTTVFPMVNGQTGERVAPAGDRLPQAGLAPDRASPTLLVNQAGLAIPVEDRAAPILDAAGHVSGMVLVFRDITDRIRAEREKAGAEAGPARITVRTGREELGEAASASSSWVLPTAAGSFATLEVTDLGSGMPPEVLARAFEPFYTTKFVGRGLGLAAVIGILRNHRGGLWVRTEPGHGSSFKIFLPVRPDPVPVATAGC
jgi:PAS domain S-box-containing protein